MTTRRSVAGLLAFISLLVVRSAVAANLDELKNTTPEERATMQTAMMRTKLGLNAAEVPKVAGINRKYAEKMEPIIKGSEGPLMKMRDAKAIEQEKEAELKKVLSPDQFQKFLAMKEEMREQLAQKVKERRATGGT